MMPSRQRGLTLVELMVAVAVGLIVMAAIAQVFINSRGTSQRQDELARLQENARFAQFTLTNELRLGGYLGCGHSNNLAPITSTVISLDPAAPDITFFDGINVAFEGFDAAGTGSGNTLNLAAANAVWTPVLDNSLLAGDGTPQPNAGSDVIVIRHARGAGLQLTRRKSDTQLFVANLGTIANGCGTNINQFSGICPDDILVLADCNKARVFRATALALNGTELSISHGLAGNNEDSWGGPADSNPATLFLPGDSRLFSAQTIALFIRNNTAGVPSLYRMVDGGAATELVEGVENMQIFYGMDTNNDGSVNRYLSAGNIANFAQVRSVRISLLLRTVSPVRNQTAASQTLNLLTDNAATAVRITTPNDSFLRRVVTATVRLRNREQ